MEVKLNFIERILMNLSWKLFKANIKAKNLVYKRYDKGLTYRGHNYSHDNGILIFYNKRNES